MKPMERRTFADLYNRLPYILFMVVLVLYVFTDNSGRRRRGATRVSLPVFSLPAPEGYGPGLSSETLKGQVSVVNLFGSWCRYCAGEMPFLADIAQENDVPVYGLAWKDREDNLVPWLETHGNPFESIGLDSTGDTGAAFGVTGTPSTVIVDKNATVRYIHSGQLSRHIWENRFLPVIGRLKLEKEVPADARPETETPPA